MSEDHIGAFPIRQDITVLPTGDPNKVKLGWVVYERLGCPLSTRAKDDPERQQMHIGQLLWPFYDPYAVTRPEDLKVGDVVWAWGYQIIVEEVTGDKGVGKFVRRDEEGNVWKGSALHLLEFVRDEKPDPCWVCTCIINDYAINMIDLGEEKK